jgi:hypothetical protein
MAQLETGHPIIQSLQPAQLQHMLLKAISDSQTFQSDLMMTEFEDRLNLPKSDQ